MSRPVPGILFALVLLLPTTAPTSRAEPPGVEVRSPGGRVAIELTLRKHGDQEAVPHYRVSFKGQEIVAPSRLGVRLDDSSLAGPCAIESVESAAHDTRYAIFPGKRRQARDRCSERVVNVRETKAPGRRWQVVLRAYDDGAAFRYRFPAQDGWAALVLADEQTEFALPRDARAFALPVNSFTTSHEKLYLKRTVAEIPRRWLMDLPLLVECPGRGWAAITEANLTDYAGLYLAHPDDGGSTLAGRLSPLPKERAVAVRAKLPHDSPWRVVMLGDEPGRLIESDLIFNLNEPCALADTSWIKPGKTTFPWWNGYYEENIPFKPGLNTATAKYYIDFCAGAGIPYHSLDGIDNIAWYGGPIVPYRGADITKGVDGLDLQEVLHYAKAKGVRIRLWMHWQAAQAHMERAFPLYHSWGVEGVMIDFMDRDDQEMVNFQRRLIRLAADNRLTVTFHGVAKPTGLERTYPNLLTSEGVLNLEYDKWSNVGCPPEHEVTVPFTRMLAGPLDFHQGSFRGVRVEDFKPRNDAPLVMGTPARTLASYVVLQNHLSMVADYPSAYRNHPGLPALARIPTTWDDTKVPSGVVGEHIVVARRSGDDWYLGATNDRRRRSLTVPLGFLGPGRYRAERYADDPANSTERRLLRSEEVVTARDELRMTLEPAGGFFARLTRLPAEGPGSAK
jgi:alpha-glucosidase